MRKSKGMIAYNPETQELEPFELEDPHTGFMDWTPLQWGMFLAALATFITTIATLFFGNPAGIPGAG